MSAARTRRRARQARGKRATPGRVVLALSQVRCSFRIPVRAAPPYTSRIRRNREPYGSTPMFRPSSRLIATYGFIAAALVAPAAFQAGCKHETPAQEAQKIAARESADVKQAEERIRQVVQDPARANQLVALLSELQNLVGDTAARTKDERAKAAALNANYAATRADYQALFGRQDALRERSLDRALAIREQMA